MKCGICARALNQADDPLSGDFRGDCGGCVGDVEADAGWPESLNAVSEEAARGLRPGGIDPATRG
jgi:hypothetical protein